MIANIMISHGISCRTKFWTNSTCIPSSWAVTRFNVFIQIWTFLSCVVTICAKPDALLFGHLGLNDLVNFLVTWRMKITILRERTFLLSTSEEMKIWLVKFSRQSCIDMISCFVNTEGIFSGHSVLANFTFINNRSNMFWLNVSLYTSRVWRAVVTVWALPLVPLLSINTLSSDHFGSYQIWKVFNRFSHRYFSIVCAFEIYEL